MYLNTLEVFVFKNIFEIHPQYGFLYFVVHILRVFYLYLNTFQVFVPKPGTQEFLVEGFLIIPIYSYIIQNKERP